MPYHRLEVRNHPKSITSEQYRRIRTNIDFSNLSNTIKVINLTGAFPKEGKTMTTLNLASTYAETKVKTLIIDMDLRKPKIHRVFKLENANGLMDYIIGNNPVEHYIDEIDEHLHVLVAGTKTPFPIEVLISEKLKVMILELREIYDKIIIDCPPITAASDAEIISNFCDGTVFVVASRKTKREVAAKCIGELKHNGANVIGGVLTRVRKKDIKYGMDYYYYYGED